VKIVSFYLESFYRYGVFTNVHFFLAHPTEVVYKFKKLVTWPLDRCHTCDKGSRVKVTSGTGRVACRDMARRTVAWLVFGIERCSILCDFDTRQSRTSKTHDKIAGVTSVLPYPLGLPVNSQLALAIVNISIQEFSSSWDGRPFRHNRPGPKTGGVPLWGGGGAAGPHLTQRRLGRGLPPYQVAC